MEIKIPKTIKILHFKSTKFNLFFKNYLGEKVFLQEKISFMFSCCIPSSIVLHNIGHGFLKHRIWCMFHLFDLLNLIGL